MAATPYDQRDGFIWLDGEMINWKDAKVHVLTHAMHYGSCVFEGERLYEGNIFKGHEHSVRLLKSAQILGMDMPISAEEIDAAKDKVIKANNLTNAYIRAFAWRGSEQMGIAAQETKTHIAVTAWEWGAYFDPAKRDNGITLITSQWRKPAADTAPTQSKAAGLYMIGTISKHNAEKAGYDDALMLDYRGYVAEASGANLFVVQGGVLKTPIPDCFLNGITRQTIISLAKDLGIPFEETRIMPQDLENVQEVFLTGTAAEVTAVGKINDIEYEVGPITRKLRDAYEALVRQPSEN